MVLATASGFPTSAKESAGEKARKIQLNGIGAKACPETCKRCGSRIVMGYYEPECLTCGYADYSHTPDISSGRQRTVVNSATRFVLRYVGDFPVLSETLAQVKLVRVRNRAVHAVTCPFCSKDMERSSLSGKRPDVREERYKCPDSHRVSLTPKKSGALEVAHKPLDSPLPRETTAPMQIRGGSPSSALPAVKLELVDLGRR